MVFLSLCLLLLFLPSQVLAQVTGGLTLEECRSDLGCTSPRKCMDTSTYRQCKTDSRDATCVCVPPSFTPCISSSDCIKGELCHRTFLTPFVCKSALVAESVGTEITAEDAEETPLIPTCSRPKSSKRDRLPTPPPDPFSARQANTPPDAQPDGPPLSVPDVPPGGPPLLPPDASSGDLELEPVAGEPTSGPPPEIPLPDNNGLSFDICQPGTCAKGLSCVTLDNSLVADFRCCKDNDPVCICHPEDSRPVCLSTAECNRGELCVKTPVDAPSCISKKSLDELPEESKREVVILRGKRPGEPGKPVPLIDTPVQTPNTAATESPDDTDLQTATPEPVTSSPLVAVTPTPSVSVTMPEPTVTPQVTENEGEVTDEAESEEDEGICIDARALDHLNRRDLVFDQDRFGRVLCDAGGSCATAGHMVRFDGKIMMMRSYCDMVGCEAKVMKVNSPRYRRAMEVKSQTEGLRYTVLAARYATGIEEGLLAHAIRFGL